MLVTFIIPVYNERDTLEPLVAGIAEHIGPHEHRVLFIDDGSTDGSFEVMARLREQLHKVDIIRFRRNFGKSAALAAGFARSSAELVFTMDADLQDDPKEIPRFIEKLNEGHDLVCGWKRIRHDPWHKTIPSHFYNRFVAKWFGVPLHDVNCGFKLFRGEVVRKIRLYGDMHRLIPVLASQLGYRVAEIPVEHHPRRYGTSKYGWERLSRGALDVFTLMFLNRHADAPGHFLGKLGLGQWGLGVLAMLASTVSKLCLNRGLCAAALFLAAVILWVGGTISLGLALTAELLVRRSAGVDTAAFIAEERIGH
ncbi:MAG: glycosyltransferase family 2 protein [Candidatus Hydrogenedentes bacterium]|nr:glycosyltransferase family 2 protein [Candidatus Hydrogenedentota bacterium]